MYSSQNLHRFYNSSNNAITFTIDSASNTTCGGNLTAGSITGNSLTTSSTNTGLYLMNGGNAIITGKIGVANLFPICCS